MPKLTYTVGGEQKTFEMKDSCSIGRVPENDIPLKDEVGSSRRHCQILKIREGVYELSDLGSTNGTKVNGQTAKRHKLVNGDEIRIGETVLVYADGSGDEEILLEEPAGRPKASAAAPSAGTSEQCYLVYAGGPKDGQKLALDKKRVTFGRNPKNTFALDEAGVSGYHCEIAREGGAYILRDLGSTNGTLVDGEPVTETALTHGARLRVGGSRFVFVDPTVSDFEKAMSSVDDLGSEWGLLRAEMDLSRAQRARRGQVVAIVGVLAVLGGAGYVAFAHPEWISGRPEPIKELAGQKLTDFSFEDGTATYLADAESGASSRLGDKNDGAPYQGNAFLVVSREGRGGRGAFASSAQAVSIASGTSYTFGGRVRAKNGGGAVVRVSWLASGKNSPVIASSATDVVTSSDWVDVRRTIARPPSDAVAARIELVNVGAGAAHFDDLYLGEAPKAAPNELSAGTLSWSVTADGQATLRTADLTVFSGASVVPGVLSDAAVNDESRRADRVGSQNVTTSAAGGWSGTLFDGNTGSAQPFKIDATIEGGRYVVVNGEVPFGAALLIPLSPSEEGVSVRTSGFFRLSDKRVVDKVQALTVGDRDRWEISASEGTHFRLGMMRARVSGKDTWALAIGGSGGSGGNAEQAPTKFSVRFDTDSTALRAAVEQIRKAAGEALQRRELGAAIQLHRQLAGALAQGSAAADEAAKEADRMEREGQNRFSKLESGRVAAVEFRDDTALAELAAEAAAIKAAYAGHEVATKAASEADAITEALKARSIMIAERRAAPLLRRANDMASRGQPLQAAAIYRGIEGAYAGTEAANQAKAARERLPSGK